MTSFIKKFFKIDERHSSIRTEIIGGFVTFLAMAYILAVNPNMLANAGMPVGGVFIATALASGIATILMGVLANYPVALSTGMGINALFTFTIVLTMGYTWQEAMAATFIESIIVLVISLTPIRSMFINAIPNGLKKAISAGIGFFIAFIGLKGAGIIVADSSTFVTLGNFADPTVLLATFGIFLAFALFAAKGKVSRYAFILSIVITAAVGLILGWCGVAGMPSFTGNYTDLSGFNQTFFGFAEGLKTVFTKTNLWFVVFSLAYLDFFDTAGTLVAVAEPAQLMDKEGAIPSAGRAFAADACGTFISSICGTTPVTSFVESAAGVEAGARTGFASVITGLLLIVSIVAYPVFSVFITSSAVTAMALVLVGVLMMSQLQGIKWDDKPTLVAAFVTIIIMMLTYSIGNGIAFGFVTYTITMLVQKRWKEVSPVLYVLSTFFVVYYAISAVL